jgi:hypothetical protein
MSITGATAPGNTSVGGVLSIKSLAQLQREKADATQDNNEPYVQALAGYIRGRWMEARLAKEMTVEQRMFASVRQRRGIYDPDKMAQIMEQGGSQIYMMITSGKCRSAAAWLRDALLTTSEGKPWEIRPSKQAQLDPQTMSEVMNQAQEQIKTMLLNGQNPSPQQTREMLMQCRDMALSHLQTLAREAADRMEDKMQDQLDQGGFLESFAQFIDDITTFPSAFLKGPVVRMRNKVKWVPGPNGTFQMDVAPQLTLEWERIDPFMIYPCPDSTHVDDGYLIERHRMQRSDLTALIGVDGYSDAAIRGVLEDYGRGGLHEWINADTQKASAEGKSTFATGMNPSQMIDALQFWGSVQGQTLLEWGMDEKDVPDPFDEYNIEAWLIGTWVIKASINPDPLGRKPYYKASYEEIPGAFWGNSVCDLARDTQDVCNATARALVNNLAIASGPQTVINVDCLPQGENITQLYPWKQHQVVTDPTMGANQKPIEFFQPNSNAQELLIVYDKFSTLADEYTGIPRYMTGDSPSGGAGRTASGMSMLMSNAGKSIKNVISNIDVNVIEPIVDRLYFYNMRYSTDPDLKGDINVVATGASDLVNKEADSQRQEAFLQAAVSNPLVQQVVGLEGIANLLHEQAKKLGLNADEIVKPIAILKQQWQAQQQAQAQAALAGQPPGPGAPPGLPAPGGPQQPPGVSAPGGTPAQPGPGPQLMNGAPVTNHFPPH